MHISFGFHLLFLEFHYSVSSHWIIFFSFAKKVMLKSTLYLFVFPLSLHLLANKTGPNLIYSCISFLLISDLPPPATRERPPGCKTVFVGGLPENATEQLIMEVFGQCGDITAIRKSKKNFCHIRFAEEVTVDKALFLSGEQSYFFILLYNYFMYFN